MSYDLGALFSSERGRRVLAWLKAEGRDLSPAEIERAMREAERLWSTGGPVRQKEANCG